MTIRYLLIGSGIILMIAGIIIIFNKKNRNNNREGILISLLGLALMLLPFLMKNDKIDLDKRIIK